MQKVKKENLKCLKINKQFEVEEHSNIYWFIADVKTSPVTRLMTEPFVISKVIESNYWPGGIFTFAYNEYTVVTHPFGWVCKRRENDFIKLREYLCKVYPQYWIPPLVFPKAVYDNYSLKEKEIYFTKFLNDILSNEELRAWTYLELFLTTENEEKYKPIRKKYDKQGVKPTELADYSTIDGKVSINASSLNAELCKNYNAMFINKFQYIFLKI